MNLLSYLKNKLFPIDSSKNEQNHAMVNQPPLPKKPDPISCIAQCILDDLDDVDKWKVKKIEKMTNLPYNNLYSWSSVIFNLIHKEKKYSLLISNTTSVFLNGIDYSIFHFSPYEVDLIQKKSNNIINLKNQKSYEIKKIKGTNKLAKYFPECFVRHSIRLPPKPETKKK